jgi:hypothetical protein
VQANEQANVQPELAVPQVQPAVPQVQHLPPLKLAREFNGVTE